MATRERHPTDVAGDDLVRTYVNGIARLEQLTRDALRRGLDPERLGTPDQRPGDATAAYRARQLAQARAILQDLLQRGPRLAPVAVARAYSAGVVAVDVVLQGAELRGAFGGVHQGAVQVLAANLSRSLQEATGRVGENIATVFERATMIEQALDPSTPDPLRGLPIIGRRVDDPYRRIALEVIGQGTVSLDTRRQVSAQLVRRLTDQGVTDAMTGFIDSAGRRWQLPTYAEMVARTTTREATSAATLARMGEHRADLVTISSHPHAADVCTPYDGETFSITGRDPSAPMLDQRPPFHPRCRHVATPAAANLDRFENELRRAVEGQPR